MAEIIARNENQEEMREESRFMAEFKRIEQLIPYGEFLKEFLLPNKPCLFSGWLTESWECRKRWLKNVKNVLVEANQCSSDTPDSSRDGDELNVEYLSNKYGSAVVPVAECAKQEFDSHPKIEMKLTDYLQYLQTEAVDDQILYLKDWHFQREFREEPVYSTPIYFQSDWLNEYCDLQEKDDYRFLYLGPKGSWTPFHADVFRSFSWSANVVGRKRWLIFPPGEEAKLRDKSGRLPFDVRTSLIGRDDVTWHDVIQEAGEVIYIPSGWHHQVHNLETTLSLNHNWYNGCNIDLSWRHLAASLGDVQKEIIEWRESMGEEEWTQHCQMMLKALSGMNYSGFYKMLKTIADIRLSDDCQGSKVNELNELQPRGVTECDPGATDISEVAKTASVSTNEQSSLLGTRQSEEQKSLNETIDNPKSLLHSRFDLQRIEFVLSIMLENEDFLRLDVCQEAREFRTLLRDELSQCDDTEVTTKVREPKLEEQSPSQFHAAPKHSTTLETNNQ